ncbi:MAG: hypothetical protein KKD00_10020, partial [Gammaproteobacteria bacterium]|nr:hypothetical protein [Gammaproteobacteria bacterium]
SPAIDCLKPAGKIIVFALLVLLSACGRKFSVSLNEQMLYDPRPGNTIVTVADAGLQSCINVLMRDRSLTDPSQVQVLACPALDIESLAGIGQLANLRFLDVAGNLLTNLDGLSTLDNLSSVNAPDNRLQDVSAIMDLTTLSSAVLTGNPQIPCVQLAALSENLGNNLLTSATCVP